MVEILADTLIRSNLKETMIRNWTHVIMHGSPPHMCLALRFFSKGGGRNGRGGYSRPLTLPLIVESHNPKNTFPISQGPEALLPIIQSNQLSKGKGICSDPPTHCPKETPPITSTEPPICSSLRLEPRESLPQPLAISFSRGSSLEPLLISSKPFTNSSEPPNPTDRHLLVVDKVVDALSNTDQMDEQLEDHGSDDFGSLPEPDDDMVLYQYQKDIKLEALARREPSKSGTK